jgi:hypothetical protein
MVLIWTVKKAKRREFTLEDIIGDVAQLGEHWIVIRRHYQVCRGRLQEGHLFFKQNNASSNLVRDASFRILRSAMGLPELSLWRYRLLVRAAVCLTVKAGSIPVISAKFAAVI